MRSLLRLLLIVFTLGTAMIGCGKKSDPPPEARDVTLSVPAMN